MDIRFILCSAPVDFQAAKQVTRDYLGWLAMDLSFQDLDHEFAEFPAMYGPPRGAYLIARVGGELAGGVALRGLEDDTCEMKRLFVYEPFRGHRLGAELCARIVAVAGELGYRRMRLDTIDRLTAAIRLYERLGFREIPPYRYNPDPTARFMELTLSHGPGSTLGSSASPLA